ncbi:MAG: family 43 glycosylhydrolase [Clostridia bacterium]|nr:family 43 glycosylhydrolase [Clostridia bacterium]
MKETNNRNRVRLLSLSLLSAILFSAVSCAAGPVDPGAAESAAETEAGSDAPLPFEDGAVYRIETPGWYALSGGDYGAAENAGVLTYGTADDLNQLWRVHVAGGGILFENMSAGLYLNVRTDSKKEGAPLALNSRSEIRSQLWTAAPAEGKENAFFLQNAATGGFAKDTAEETTGTAVQTLLSEDATPWTFKKIAGPDTVFPRVLILSGDYVSAANCPEIRKIGGVYYNFNQAGGIAIKRSSDLRRWTSVGTVVQTTPDWLRKGGYGSIWAPGCYLVGDTLRCYYAVSSFGSQNSAIGMAYCANGNPASDWKDGGMVISSKAGDPYNCIDPNIFVEDDGTTYLIFGSYWTGIYMRKIDPATGLLDETDPTLWHLAQGQGEMEAPYLIKKDGYYYLFVAMGNISKNDTYHWAVGRSESLFGPYLDKKGNPMLEGNVFALTEYKNGVQRVGHAQCFLDDDGTYYMVAESWRDRFDPTCKVSLHISTIVWNDQGWPVTALARDLPRELAGKK